VEEPKAVVRGRRREVFRVADAEGVRRRAATTARNVARESSGRKHGRCRADWLLMRADLPMVGVVSAVAKRQETRLRVTLYGW